MNRIFTVAAALAMIQGCVIYADGDGPADDDIIIIDDNFAPDIIDAQAGCFYDNYLAMDIWYFDASVDDPDGPFDTYEVFADVYDDLTGELIESFELFGTEDPYLWTSEWDAATTYIDCWYPWYTVEVVAYDFDSAWDQVSIIPETYF